VLKFRSVRSIVSPPANTGTAKISITAVTADAQINKTIWDALKPTRALTIVAKKLIEAIMEEAPATWREKMARSIE
jgi:hypothetical protein